MSKMENSNNSKRNEAKLYYKDPYITSFSTNIQRQEQDEEGRWYLVLDETAFYPTGGGQPHDTGMINNVNVMDVEEVAGEIRHYLAEELQTTENIVQGKIDWKRRFDHMQQHAGQHILTAAFVELFGIATVSFHLGKKFLTIDLDVEELTEQQAEAAEELANQIILENRLIETKWVTEDELAQYSLRKKLSVSENIRLVIIPEFDYNGCGGTHPKSTAEVGAITILNWEKQRKHTRVQFICGNRVRQQLHQKHTILKELTGQLSVPEQDVLLAVKKVLENEKALEKSLEESKGRLIKYEANDYIANALHSEQGMIISAIFQNSSIQEIQTLARTITSLSNESIVLFVNETEEKLQFICARGSVPSISMKQLAANLVQLLDGKGGGSDQFAQGGGKAIISGEQFLCTIVEKLEEVH